MTRRNRNRDPPRLESTSRCPHGVEMISDKLLREIPLFRNLNATERRQLAEIIHE